MRWLYSLHDDLAWFNPSGLLELTIGLPWKAGQQVVLGDILHQCPNLDTLSILSVRPEVSRNIREPELIGLQETSRSKDVAVGRCGSDSGGGGRLLRSLHLDNVRVSARSLQSFFPFLKRLTELAVLLPDCSPNAVDDVFFQSNEEAQVFWMTFATNCLLVESIRFSNDSGFNSEIPLDLFPHLHQFGFHCKGLVAQGTLSRLALGEVPSRLTTLEMMRGSIPEQTLFRRKRDVKRARILHRFLCSSPHLLHFRAGGSEALLTLRVMRDLDDLGTVWSCRNLRTLSMEMAEESNDLEMSRQLFGYVSRVCPRLLELSLVFMFKNRQVHELESGLCLLTRIKSLQKLEFSTFITAPYTCSGQPLHRSDFAWIQGCATVDSNRAFTTNGSASSTTPNSFTFGHILRGFISTTPSLIVITRDDYSVCQRTLASRLKPFCLSSMGDAEHMMYLQQRRNRFRMDCDRSIPMVDGLDDLEVCGSALDMEACLRSQLFHRRGALIEKSISPATTTATATAATATATAKATAMAKSTSTKPQPQVWPQMRQITFRFKIVTAMVNKNESLSR